LDKFSDKDGNSREHIQRVEEGILKVWINLEIKMVTGENRSAGGGRQSEGLVKVTDEDVNWRDKIGGGRETS
jgi:hypothetical protein